LRLFVGLADRHQRLLHLCPHQALVAHDLDAPALEPLEHLQRHLFRGELADHVHRVYSNPSIYLQAPGHIERRPTRRAAPDGRRLTRCSASGIVVGWGVLTIAEMPTIRPARRSGNGRMRAHPSPPRPRASTTPRPTI